MIQTQFISKVLNSNEKDLITKNDLTDEFFPDYKDEFNYIKNHIKKYGTVPDKETFLSVFKKFPYIKEVKETNDYLLDALIADKKTANIITTHNQIVKEGKQGRWDEAARLSLDLAETLKKSTRIQSVGLFEDTSRYDKYIDKISNKSGYYVTTGFTELDSILGGWDRKNEYATFIGRPGRGKSWILTKSAAAAMKAGLKVGIFEGEMDYDKISYRLDTMLSNLSNKQLTKGIDGLQTDYKAYFETAEKDIKGSIRILTPPMVGGRVGVGTLQAFIENDELDILFVDQHSLLDDDRGGKSAIDRAANISKDIKQLQVLKQIPIITVSQQNRESTMQEGVSTKNIAMSDRIGQDSTVVIALERKDDILTLNIIKARDGGDDSKLSYLINLDKGAFTYMPSEDDGNPNHESSYENLRNQFDYTEEELSNKSELYDAGDDSPF